VETPGREERHRRLVGQRLAVDREVNPKITQIQPVAATMDTSHTVGPGVNPTVNLCDRLFYGRNNIGYQGTTHYNENDGDGDK
jgi:hypothetical protein